MHICHQRGLLEKLQVHFEEVRGPMLTSIEAYYDQVQELLPHSDDRKKDKANYTNAGCIWLQLCSAEIVFYGRYVDEFNESFIDRAFKKTKRGSKNLNGTLDIAS